MTFSKMIPKKIHYIWFGGSKPSSLLAAIDTWKKRAPEYSIVEWNEKIFRILKVIFIVKH